jgi:hypothetical protein
MKAQLVGILNKVFPIQQINGKFKQDILVIEPGVGENGKPKPVLINNWADEKVELENMALQDLIGEKVICDCYWNGYQYTSQQYGTQYGIRVSLINIRVPE